MTRWLAFSMVLTLVSLAGSWYLYAYQYDQLPDRIPVHWNIEGVEDNWLPKTDARAYFMQFPGLMAGLTLLTVVLRWLSPRPFDVERFRGVFEYAMFLVVALMGYLQFVILWGSLEGHALNARLLVAGVFFFLALLGNVLGKVKRNFWMGVRTPWTLASESVWIATHRLAAWMFLCGGLLGGVAVLAGVPMIVCFGVIVIISLAPIVFSCVFYKRLARQGRLE